MVYWLLDFARTSHWPSCWPSLNICYLTLADITKLISSKIWSNICKAHQILIHFVCLWQHVRWSSFKSVALPMHSICWSLSYTDVEVLKCLSKFMTRLSSLIKGNTSKYNVSKFPNLVEISGYEIHWKILVFRLINVWQTQENNSLENSVSILILLELDTFSYIFFILLPEFWLFPKF